MLYLKQEMRYTCETSRKSDHGEVKLAQKGRVAQRGRPDLKDTCWNHFETVILGRKVSTFFFV